MLAGIFWKAGVNTKDVEKIVRAALPLKGRWQRIRGWDTSLDDVLRSYQLATVDTVSCYAKSLAMEWRSDENGLLTFRLAAPAVNYVLLEIADFDKWLAVLQRSEGFRRHEHVKPSIWLPTWEGGLDRNAIITEEERKAMLDDLLRRTNKEKARLALALRLARDRLSRVITSAGTRSMPLPMPNDEAEALPVFLPDFISFGE